MLRRQPPSLSSGSSISQKIIDRFGISLGASPRSNHQEGPREFAQSFRNVWETPDEDIPISGAIL
jgi:hypothetical protein